MWGRRRASGQKLFELSLFADFFQVHIQDDGPLRGDLGAAWTPEATTIGLAAADGVVAIGTLRNVTVPVLVVVCDQPPVDDSSEWDSVAEASIECRSGAVAVLGCTDFLPDAQRVPLGTGWFRLRASGRGYDSIVTEWEDANDVYRVQLWRAPEAPVQSVKVYDARS